MGGISLYDLLLYEAEQEDEMIRIEEAERVALERLREWREADKALDDFREAARGRGLSLEGAEEYFRLKGVRKAALDALRSAASALPPPAGGDE